ncbi:hypothetical protein [Nonomuraea turcica]|nr:hypothetical protein [Nonomuraea sp. G32]MDP4501130.1 hypothetical protein [Nonomuraea sp. G32]
MISFDAFVAALFAVFGVLLYLVLGAPINWAIVIGGAVVAVVANRVFDF